MTSLGIVQKPSWLHQHCRYQCNFSLLRSDLSTHLAPFHRLQPRLGFLLLLPLLVVVYQIQPFNVVELQHSPLSNSTSVTSYIHRMIISPPCLFKHMKNDGCVAMFFQCLLDHTQQNCISVSFHCWEITFQKVYLYINLRHSVLTCKALWFVIQYYFCEQVFSSALFSCFLYSFPPFYATLVCIAGSQLEKLRENLLLVKDDIDQFKSSIRNHQKILQ